MKRLSYLLMVLAMVLASTGAPAASAGKPGAPEIILVEPTATCLWNVTNQAYDLNLTTGTIDIVGGELSNINLNAARLGEVTPPLYGQMVRESWYFRWWEGSNDAAPRRPYVFELNTRDAFGQSWTGHELMGLKPDYQPTLVDTGYWEVGIWVEASATQGKGNRGQGSRTWLGSNWHGQCVADGEDIVLMPTPEFTWCWEDQQTGPGLWTQEEGDPTLIECPLP